MPTALDLTYKAHLYTQNKERIADQEKQYAYYSGDSDKMKEYLKKVLEITYRDNDIEKTQINYINLTKKMIDQMAVVYRDPASRYFESLKPTKDTEGNENRTAQDKLTLEFNSRLPNNLSSIDNEAHRQAKLSNCSLTFVTIDKKKKLIKYVVNPVYKYTVEIDDEGNLSRLMYDRYLKDKKGRDELFTVVWENKKHYLLDSFGNESAPKENPDMVNPYGVIPVVQLKMHISDDYFGEGQNDLININEQINLLLTKIITNDILFATEGTTLAINCEFNKKSTIDGTLVSKEVQTGKKHPISVDNVRTDMVTPSIQHITTSPYINEIKDYIDWYIKFIASMKGLNPSAILAQLKDTSDYQKIMDAVDQMEMRKDDLEPCRIYEKDRFDLTKLVWNTHAEEIGEKKITDDGFVFKIDFAEIGIHKTIQDEQAEFEFNLKYNLTTPAEFLMNKNPDLTIEQAEKIIEKNKKDNDALKKQMTRLEQLTQVPKAGVETPESL